ncbi:MAG: cobyric acid synthase [Rhodospirillales bacterium]|nr:cobyric acid synthase [Rhodospirillales bacterium]
MATPAVMVQGTGSDVGKSLLVAGLARALTRRGLAVRPFKPQNMSNNAGVTADGGEIGRAQMLQARACGAAPSVHMNPVLLKPQSEKGAQVVVQGKVFGSSQARAYHELKPQLIAKVLESFGRVSAEADLVLVEGAGSPAEINLRAGDIANMGFAEAAEVPVVLAGDIDRGGVIAAVVGTMALLDSDERARVKGYCINKFRGDVSLFDGAIDIIRDRTGLDCLGVVPHMPAARCLPAEDAVALDSKAVFGGVADGAIKVAVPRFDRISNFDDLDPLAAEPDVAVTLVNPGDALPGDADLIVLPGSKSTKGDLAAMKANGWDIDLAAHVRRGGWVVGLCGGYQMLGRTVSDPDGIEGPAGNEPGLGLLDIDTVLAGDKTLVAMQGHELATGEEISGYEMHIGVTEGPARARPMVELASGPDGAVSTDGRVMGCYLHGLFAADGFRHAFLARLKARAESGIAFEAQVEHALDEVADTIEATMNLDHWLEIARGR